MNKWLRERCLKIQLKSAGVRPLVQEFTSQNHMVLATRHRGRVMKLMHVQYTVIDKHLHGYTCPVSFPIIDVSQRCLLEKILFGSVFSFLYLFTAANRHV